MIEFDCQELGPPEEGRAELSFWHCFWLLELCTAPFGELLFLADSAGFQEPALRKYSVMFTDSCWADLSQA